MIKTIGILILLTLIEIVTFHYYIKRLKKVNYTQFVRDLGPKNHHIKNGTPTAGGIIIIVFLILNFIIVKNVNGFQFQINDYIFLITIILFGILGFMDDFKIIKKKKNDGLKPLSKLIVETLIVIVIFILLKIQKVDNTIIVLNQVIDLSYFNLVWIMFYILAWSNSFNITDGLDGLASYLSLSVLLGIFIVGKIEHNELLVVSSLCMFFSIIGFLVFNFHPALVFMGNVGSHALGAGIAILGILSKNEVVFGIMGLVFVFETISVILQVIYFKKTKGKRLFRMAPFHHHLELSGFKEQTISLIFVLISILLVIISIILKGI